MGIQMQVSKRSWHGFGERVEHRNGDGMIAPEHDGKRMLKQLFNPFCDSIMSSVPIAGNIHIVQIPDAKAGQSTAAFRVRSDMGSQRTNASRGLSGTLSKTGCAFKRHAKNPNLGIYIIRRQATPKLSVLGPIVVVHVGLILAQSL